MKILSLDSTALTASVAICENEKLLAEYTVNCGNTHSETLLPMISEVLKKLGMSVSEIDMFSCSAGPGSFTGVRIGAATVKGLAFGSGKPCIGVSTLKALAKNINGYDDRIICPVMNARRNQVYNALFSPCGERLCDDRALSIDELFEELSEIGRKVILCGDGTFLTLKGFDNRIDAVPAPERALYQSAYSVAQCAFEEYNNGLRTFDTDLVPIYLRLSQAERERLARESGSMESNEKIMASKK